MPGLGNLVAGLLVGKITEAILISDGRADSQVSGRKNIRPAEGEHQKHLGGPATDPFNLGQFFDDAFIRAAPDGSQDNLSPAGLAGQVQDVGCFLLREADRAKLPGCEA